MKNSMGFLVRLVLNWEFSEIISRFCATLSAIGCIFLFPHSYISILQICILISLYLHISVSQIYIFISLIIHFNSANLHSYISVSPYLYLSNLYPYIPIHMLQFCKSALLHLCISISLSLECISLYRVAKTHRIP